MLFFLHICICDPFWEKRTSPVEFHNEIEAINIDAIITAVSKQILIKDINSHYF